MQQIAMIWLVYRLTNSVFLLGFYGFCSQIPMFVLAPFTGVISDRYNRYFIMIGTQISSLLQALILAILFYTGTIQIWHLFVAGIYLGCVNALDIPARQSFVIDMIEERKDLGNAIAINSSMVNGARLLGPAIAGILIATTGEGACFLLNTLSYFFVISSLLMMSVTPREMQTRHSHIFQGLKEGFSYTFGFVPIRYIILLLGLVSLMGMPYTILMPVFATQILHGGPHTFGFLMGSLGLGAFIGALYLAGRKNVLGLLKVIPIAAATFGLGLIAFALSRLFYLSLVLLLFVGLGMIIELAASNTIIQTLVDDNKRGRVMSIYTMAFMGTAPFGSLLTGKVASMLGAPNTLIFGGILCIVGSVFFWSKLSEIRRIVRPIYVKLGIIPEG